MSEQNKTNKLKKETEPFIGKGTTQRIAPERHPKKTHLRNVAPLALTLAVLALNLSVIQLAQAAGFATTGSLNSARFGHASVLPNDGYSIRFAISAGS